MFDVLVLVSGGYAGNGEVHIVAWLVKLPEVCHCSVSNLNVPCAGLLL